MDCRRSLPILGAATLAFDRPGAAPDRLMPLNGEEALPYCLIDREIDDPDRIHRFLQRVVSGALERAGLSPEETRRAGLFVGSSSYDLRRNELAYRQALEADPAHARPMPGCGIGHLAGWIRQALGIGGEAFSINTACTSSANALLQAHRMLRRGAFEHAVVVGVELYNETTFGGFSSLQLISPESLKPFDRRRDGLVLGEGCAAVVLGDGEAGEGRIRFTGGASRTDLHSITGANPDGSSIAAVMQAALERCGIDRGAIRAVKAQGTGSELNDLAEARGLRRLFGDRLPPVTALKPAVGHTLGACGALEVALFARALEAGTLPATPNFSEIDPQLGIRPVTAHLPAPPGHYQLNFFGFGGNNCVLLLEKPA